MQDDVPLVALLKAHCRSGENVEIKLSQICSILSVTSCEPVFFSLLRCSATLTDSCTTCVPTFEEWYAVAAVLVGSLVPRPARRAWTKKSSSIITLEECWLKMLTNQCLKILIGKYRKYRTIHTVMILFCCLW